MGDAVPDSFFLLCINASGQQVNCGPYVQFGDASSAMDVVHIALALNNVKVEPGRVVQAKVLECMLIDGQVHVISERARDVST